ncbi:MAG: TonB-dependent receptor [Bacteroidales bacterium]|nr:TonB-dependent receptor [Bacteroidales bacterium]
MLLKKDSIFIILKIILIATIFFTSTIIKASVHTRKISITENNISLKEILKSIESQSEYIFIYDSRTVDIKKRIDVNINNEDFDKALEIVFSGLNMNYRIINKQIIIIKSQDRNKDSRSANVIIRGKVTDKENNVLSGVNIISENNHKEGTNTDIDGKFELNSSKNSNIIFSYLGHKRVIYKTTSDSMQYVNIKLESEVSEMDELKVVGYSSQRKISIIGAITTIDKCEFERGGISSISNNLVGRMAGLIGIQRSGEPGSNVSEFWIRGISTFGANRDILVLIDGVEHTKSELNNLSPEDIESFSILKDATATAVYGAKGGNGVVLINTKHGKNGKASINASFKTMIETLPRLPKYVNAFDYMNLANEALIVRGEKAKYTKEDMLITKYNLDNDLYPNVDWQKEILNQFSFSKRSNVNINGGNERARYYMSGSYQDNEAIYNYCKNKYLTNVEKELFSFRSSIDVNPTKNSEISLSIYADLSNFNKPGIESTNYIWESLATLTPVSIPKRFSNGEYPSIGKDNECSPYVLLNKCGYTQSKENISEALINYSYKFQGTLEGLTFKSFASIDNYNLHVEKREKCPALYDAIGRDIKTGKLITKLVYEGNDWNYQTLSDNQRTTYFETNIEYNRIINLLHRINLLFVYNQRETTSTYNNDVINSIPKRGQGIASRISYSYRDIYFLEGNFGYNGSENFPKGNRFGFFPSLALGYIISNYDSFQNNLPFINLLKFRGSLGLVGNDIISSDVRFPYLSYIDTNAPGYSFGNFGQNSGSGITESITGTKNLKWESSYKVNFGTDLNLLNSLSLSFDAFLDKRNNIFMKRVTIPGTIGIENTPWGNVGKMRSWGYDGTLYYNKMINKALVEIRGNFTLTDNKIIDYDEITPKYYYQQKKGYSNNINRGLIALGLFKDEDDIKSSPVQFGKLMPGDIKYQDVNGDGVINNEDIVPIGYSDIPRLQYGMAASVKWNNFDFNILFAGSGKVNCFMSGNGFYPFENGETGNILDIVNNQKNRWTPESYSGDKSTENPNAVFPRLTYGYNDNNNRNSTFWQRNTSYIRLKNIEIGYTIKPNILKSLYLKNGRISFNIDNAFVWDKLKLWDPEQGSSNGAVYPLTRAYSLSLQISL